MTEDRDTLAARLLAERKEAQVELAVLTPREREVLTLHCKGLSAQEIGVELAISFKTAEAHKAHIRERLEMTLPEAIVLAARAGWV